MRRIKQDIDEQRAQELYEKYGSMNRAALSLGCSPGQLKKILLKNNVAIKIYVPVRFNINSKFSYTGIEKEMI